MVTSPFTLIPPFTGGMYPFSGVQPFTYRDAETNVEFLGRVVSYLRELVEKINTGNTEFYDELIVKLNETIALVNDALTDQTEFVLDEIAGLQTSVTTQLDEFAATVSAQLAVNNAAIADLAGQVAAFSQALADALDIDDALIALNVDTPTSSSRAAVAKVANVAEFNRGNRVSADYADVIEAIIATGVTDLYFPDGTYSISRRVELWGVRLRLASGVILYFDHVGGSSTLGLCDVVGGSVAKSSGTADPVFSGGCRIDGVNFGSDVQIYDSTVNKSNFIGGFTIGGSVVTNSLASGSGSDRALAIGSYIGCNFASVSSFDGGTFDNCDIRVRAGAPIDGRLSFRNTEISFDGAVTFGNTWNLFENCDIYTIGTLTIDASTTFDTCEMLSSYNLAGDMVRVTSGGKGSTFRNCVITSDTDPDPAHLSLIDVVAENVLIDGCTLDNHANAAAIYVEVEGALALIRGNTVKSRVGGLALVLAGASNTVHDNLFDGGRVNFGGVRNVARDNRFTGLAGNASERYNVSGTDGTVIHRDAMTYTTNLPGSVGYCAVRFTSTARRCRIDVLGVRDYAVDGNVIQGEAEVNDSDCFVDREQFNGPATGNYQKTSFSHHADLTGNVSMLPTRSRVGTSIMLLNTGTLPLTVGAGSPTNIIGPVTVPAGDRVVATKSGAGIWSLSQVG